MEEMNAPAPRNKMGTVPIPKLLLRMGAPMMLSMLGQALYNVVDTFFVSHMPDTALISELGDKAINALTLAFPVQMLMISLGVGTGVGVNAVLARSLGRRDRELASRTAGNSMFVSLCYFAAIFLFGLFGSRVFIESQTDSPVIAQMGVSYLQIVTMCSLGGIGFMCLEKIIMATGNTLAAMLGQLSGAVTNMILDPIMIYGLLGVPALGVAGAAWATVIGQFVSFFVMALLFFRGKKKELDVRFSYLRPRIPILRGIYTVGLPAIMMQLLGPVMSYGMNLILGSISASAVTAYGVYFKLQNFIFMPAFGLNNASIPIISYNYGAGNSSRILDTMKCGLLYITGIMALGILLLQLFARQFVGIFSISGESAALCVTALRIITCGFLFVGVNIILQGVCQALGSGVSSLLISLLRLLVIVLPLSFFFSKTEAAGTLVWTAIPIAEAVACVAAILLTQRQYRLHLK